MYSTNLGGMMHTDGIINQAAALLGRMGGKSTSDAKRIASRENGKAGGRPSMRDRAERRVTNSPKLQPYRDTIMYDWPEGNEHWRWVLTARISEIIDWAETVELPYFRCYLIPAFSRS
jgi:hypothetical protein